MKTNKRNAKILRKKIQYHKVDCVFGFLDEYKIFVNVNSSSIKRFSTYKEKSDAIIHKYEYSFDYDIKIRAKRSTAIANPWDDYRSYVYKNEKSWKHSTKRKKQHYK